MVAGMRLFIFEIMVERFRSQLRDFPKGPNGFRTVDGVELSPSDVKHAPQLRFDEFVMLVKDHGARVEFSDGTIPDHQLPHDLRPAETKQSAQIFPEPPPTREKPPPIPTKGRGRYSMRNELRR